MAVFLLNKSLQMPSPELAEADGLLAIGGDLSAERLLSAYKMGIFPWFNEDDDILWWSPDPRFVLFPKDLKVSKSMKQILNRKVFKVSYNKAFTEVIQACKSINRNGHEGTWITDSMEKAYIELHEKGFAQSVEVWNGNQLVGGLYGLLLGNIYFGESMYSKESNASKFGFIHWVKKLSDEGLVLIDCQLASEHLRSLGASEISRSSFLKILRKEFIK